MDKVYKAYGQVMAALFDRNEPVRKELSATPLMHERCPRCEAMVNESMDRCPECGLYIAWDNSKEWRVTYTMKAKTAWNQVRQKPLCEAESQALTIMKSSRWAAGTLGKLNQLRKLTSPFQLTRDLRNAARNALYKAGGSRRGGQNYFLAVAIAQLVTIDEVAPISTQPGEKLEDVKEWF